MCLAVPMKLVEINGFSAFCEARGITRKVSLFLLQHETLAPGDHVMVHLGDAVRKMTEAEAQSTWDLYDEFLAAETKASLAVGAPASDLAGAKPG